MSKFYELIDIIFIFMIAADLESVLHIYNINNFNSLILGLKLIIYTIMLIRLCMINMKSVKWGTFILYVFIGYCILNLIISKNISASVQTLVYLILNTLYAYVLYCEYSIEKALKLFMIPLSAITIISTATSIILKNYGQYYDVVYNTNVWSGIFTHKNTFGSVCGLTIIIFLVSLNYKKLSNKYKVVFILTIINLYFSYSHTPAYAAIACVLYIAMKKIVKKEFALSIFNCILLFNYVYIFKYNIIKNIFSISNMDASGRRAIYNIILMITNNQPILGYGLSAEWMEKGGIASTLINKYIGFNPNSCHNGFLELLLQLGYIGLGIYLILIGSIFIKAAEAYNTNKKYSSLIAILIYIILVSTFESNLAEFKSIYWILQIYILFQFDRRKKKEITINRNLINV